MPQRADGYQVGTASSYQLDNFLYDGDTATGYSLQGSANGSVSISVVLDLGPSPTPVKQFRAVLVYYDTLTLILESSNDFQTWTSRASLQTFGSSCVETTTTVETRPFTTPITARYWRMSVADTDSEGCGLCRIQVREIEVKDSSLVHIAEYVTPSLIVVTKPGGTETLTKQAFGEHF